MPELVLDLLKYVFLVMLYVFIARVVRLIYLELKPATARSAPVSGGARPAPSRPPSRKSKGFKKVAIIEGPKSGKTLELGGEMIIGRGDKCQLVLDDSYVSQVHARIYQKDDSFLVEDMGSTNGTYLNRRRITSPVELKRGDQVKIGKSVLEMRK